MLSLVVVVSPTMARPTFRLVAVPLAASVAVEPPLGGHGQLPAEVRVSLQSEILVVDEMDFFGGSLDSF